MTWKTSITRPTHRSTAYLSFSHYIPTKRCSSFSTHYVSAMSSFRTTAQKPRNVPTSQEACLSASSFKPSAFPINSFLAYRKPSCCSSSSHFSMQSKHHDDDDNKNQNEPDNVTIEQTADVTFPPDFDIACPVNCVLDVDSEDVLDAYTQGSKAGDRVFVDFARRALRKEPRLVVLEVYSGWSLASGLVSQSFHLLCQRHPEVVFMKLEAKNFPVVAAKKLGIRTLPTFILFKGGKRIDHWGAREFKFFDQFIADNI